jgi:hypothetical protein
LASNVDFHEKAKTISNCFSSPLQKSAWQYQNKLNPDTLM